MGPIIHFSHLPQCNYVDLEPHKLFLLVTFLPQGYGQTECCGACCLTLESDHSLGHVGGVLPSNQIKLESVPEMGYLAEEGKGEICLKGPNVFKG